MWTVQEKSHSETNCLRKRRVSENGEKSDRAVEQYDSTEINGFVDETKQVIKCCCAYTIIKSLSEKKEKPKLSNHGAFVWVSGIYSF